MLKFGIVFFFPDDASQEPSHGHRGHELVVAVVRVQREGPLSHVHEALREADHEEVVSVLGMVLSQLSQHGGQARVVSARAQEAHGKDGVVRYLGVLVVRKLAEGVEDVELRVRGRDEAEGEGDGAAYHGLAVSGIKGGNLKRRFGDSRRN